MTFTIRTAKDTDARNILDLIKGLALYEKEPDAVKCTEEDLIRDGLDNGPYFKAFIAETDEGKPVGFALYFFTWSTWKGRPTLFLEDLFVDPDFRGKGLGLELFKKVAKQAVTNKCLRMEWSVLDWNHLARDFYHAFGARHNEGWLPYRLTGEELKKFAKEP